MPAKKGQKVEIRPYPKNAKKHPDSQLKQIAASIKEFGWQQPIVVDKEGIIIVGHGRWFAYEKFGEEYGLLEPEIKVANLTTKQASAYRLADNKLNESDWDMELVIEELKAFEDEALVTLIGFEGGLVKVGNTLDEISDVLIDQERLSVIEVLPPESPRLKEHFYLMCDTKEEYDVLKLAFREMKLNSKDIVALL